MCIGGQGNLGGQGGISVCRKEGAVATARPVRMGTFGTGLPLQSLWLCNEDPPHRRQGIGRMKARPEDIPAGWCRWFSTTAAGSALPKP